MNRYHIRNPNGATYTLWAETVYQAIQQAIKLDAGKWASSEYFKANKIKTK